MVYDENAVDVGDFEKIKAHIAGIAGSISVHIVKDQEPGEVLVNELAQRPTMVFSPMQLRKFYVKRGVVYAGRPMQKSEQLMRLEQAGVAVPAWTSFDRGKRFDPDFWGEYVVVKPEIGSRAKGVTIRKTEWLNNQSQHLDNFRREGQNFVIQKLVRSKLFSHIRVQTLFDEVLYALQYRLKEEIDYDSEQGLQKFEGYFISRTNKREYCYLGNIFELTKTVYRAFDGVPLLGLDVLLDESGCPFFIEANPGGNTWHYSSSIVGKGYRAQGLYLEQQFGAFERAGDVLAKRAQQDAV